MITTRNFLSGTNRERKCERPRARSPSAPRDGGDGVRAGRGGVADVFLVWLTARTRMPAATAPQMCTTEKPEAPTPSGATEGSAYSLELRPSQTHSKEHELERRAFTWGELERSSPELQADREVVLAAVQQDGRSSSLPRRSFRQIARWCWQPCGRMAGRSMTPCWSCGWIARWCWRPCGSLAKRSSGRGRSFRRIVRWC